MYRSGIRYSESVREFQSVFILTVLREQRANQVRAAQKLGMHRNTLRRIFGISNSTSGRYVLPPVAHRPGGYMQIETKEAWKQLGCGAVSFLIAFAVVLILARVYSRTHSRPGWSGHYCKNVGICRA